MMMMMTSLWNSAYLRRLWCNNYVSPASPTSTSVFGFLHFPKCLSMTLPGEQQWVCCVQLLVLCVGRSSKSIVRSSERLVKRKSCSPDSQTPTCLFSASVGVSAHYSWFLPACFVNIGAKWRLKREAVWFWGAETKPRHFPLISTFSPIKLLNLEKAF